MKKVLRFLTQKYAINNKIIRTEDIFSDNITEFIKDRTSKPEYETIFFIIGEYIKALNFCKEKRIALAEYYFSYADNLRDTQITKPLFFNFIRATEYPAKAYYYFKLKDYDNALKKTTLSIEIDTLLENDDIDVMQMHKIQQVHNLARIDFKRKNYENWLKKINSILNYLINLQEPNDLLFKWDKFKLEKIDGVLVQRMIMQVLNETLFFILGLSENLKNLYFSKLLDTIEIENDRYLLLEQIRDWKKLLLEIRKRKGNLEDIENSVLKFLKMENDYCILFTLKMVVIYFLTDSLSQLEKVELLEIIGLQSDFPKKTKDLLTHKLNMC